MSQEDFLREFDAAAFAAFRDAGIADEPTYQASGAASAEPCGVVLIDRAMRDFADDLAPVGTSYVRVTLQLAQVAPERGGRLTVGGETYVLDSELERDSSVSRWVVVRA